MAGCGHRSSPKAAALDPGDWASSVTPYATEYVRFGTGLMNDEDDVAAALAAVRAL